METLIMSEKEFDVLAQKLDNNAEMMKEIKQRLDALPCISHLERIVKNETRINGHFTEEASNRDYKRWIITIVVGFVTLGLGILLKPLIDLAIQALTHI